LGYGGSENGLEVGGESGSYLIRSCGGRAIRIGEKRNGVFPVSFDDTEMKEVCVAITFDCPTFFGSLKMIDFLSILKVLVLLVELMLKGGVLLRRVERLISKNLLFNGVELISSIWFESAPFLKICSQKTSFVRKGARG
jgi:hypothetical protein